MSDGYDHWRTLLSGQWVNIAPDEPPRLGFYRKRLFAGKLAPWAAVSIFEHEGEIIAVQSKRLVNEPGIVPIESVWPSCARNPISEETYRAVCAGEPWPENITTFKRSA